MRSILWNDRMLRGSNRAVRAAVMMALLLALLLLVAACQATTAARQVTLTVSAASSLAQAFAKIGERFEAETGHQVLFNFGSSGQLAQQIEQGAPVDVFVSADAGFVDALVQAGRVLPETVQPCGRGRIVLWTRADSSHQISGVTELARSEFGRIAIANPDRAPYGAAARQAMQTVGVWEAVQPRLVLGESVQQVLQYAETGNVDVAVVALSLIVPAGGGAQGRWTLIPEDLHQPIDHVLAVVRDTPHEAEARAFVAFVVGPLGQEIMAQYGFTSPK